MRLPSFTGLGTFILLSGFLLCSCSTDDPTATTQDACAAVACGHGICVESGGQASCECDDGYHLEGPTCVLDETGNTAPEFTSTPPTDATEMVSVAYDITCSDADGDPLVLQVGSDDTCEGSLVDRADGTGTYEFMVTDAASTPSCVLALTCSDGTETVTQSQTVTVHPASPAVCEDDPDYLGQLDGSTDPTSIHGGMMATEPWDSSYDAGLDDLMAALPAEGSSLVVNLPITEATVIAAYRQSEGLARIYVADANAAFKVFPNDPNQPIPFIPKTGMRVSFTATEITNYDGVPEITEVDVNSWNVDGTGFEVPVKVIPAGTAITVADVNQVIRATGTLVSDPVECGGGFDCYDLDYGAGSPVVFRTVIFNDFAQGTCITFQGPVTLFDGQPQLTTYGDEWYTGWVHGRLGRTARGSGGNGG